MVCFLLSRRASFSCCLRVWLLVFLIHLLIRALVDAMNDLPQLCHICIASVMTLILPVHTGNLPNHGQPGVTPHNEVVLPGNGLQPLEEHWFKCLATKLVKNEVYLCLTFLVVVMLHYIMQKDCNEEELVWELGIVVVGTHRAT